MYHVIGPATSTPYPALVVSTRDFAAQLRWLRSHGFHGVTLDHVYAHWHAGAPLPRKPIVLTFDDGYRGDVDVAMPLLRRMGWPGVLNLQIGNLIPARVRRLIHAGWEIDSHTFTHPDLTTVDHARLVREVAGSRRWIRAEFHQPVLFFCYPDGRFDGRVLAEVRRTGYAGATTTIPGLASPRLGIYTLRRIRVERGEGAKTLGAQIAHLEAHA
jgi:peptidoglycan/xylan/chitin deacetylase (PgdA/CDA1 family)